MTDAGLREKLWAMYTFEEDFTLNGYVCGAVDPFTGKALDVAGSYHAGAAAAPAGRGGSRRAYRSGSAPLSLVPIVESPAADSGISVSFWAYNAETLVGETETGRTPGYSNLIGWGTVSIGWGYLYVGGFPVHPGDSLLGRAAYTDESYAIASAELSAEQLTAATENPYYVPNAVSGALESEAAGVYERAMAENMAECWRYVTVTLSAEEGIRFYADGQLAYAYSVDLLNMYASFAGATWGELCADAWTALENGEASLFGEPTGIFVDDVIFGSALTETEAERLYADISR